MALCLGRFTAISSGALHGATGETPCTRRASPVPAGGAADRADPPRTRRIVPGTCRAQERHGEQAPWDSALHETVQAWQKMQVITVVYASAPSGYSDAQASAQV
jgi:hypothetical protein